MKILAGEMRGRGFDQPKTSAVRPLSEKVRAAMFDVYGDVSGKIVLDAYAGSGAAGFEALSRGASMVEAIEGNQRVARVINENSKLLKLDWGYILHVMTVETWLAIPANQPDSGTPISRYDLIIADPPYAQLKADILERLGRFLVPDGVLCVSHSSKRPSPQLDGLEVAKYKEYGDTSLSFYRMSD